MYSFQYCIFCIGECWPAQPGGMVGGGGGVGGRVGTGVGFITVRNQTKWISFFLDHKFSAHELLLIWKRKTTILTCALFGADSRSFQIGSLYKHSGAVQRVRTQAVEAVLTLRSCDGDLLLTFSRCCNIRPDKIKWAQARWRLNNSSLTGTLLTLYQGSEYQITPSILSIIKTNTLLLHSISRTAFFYWK